MGEILMTEKVMEDLIKRYPNEFLEEGLTLIGQQIPVNTGRIDLLFRTKLDEILVVEIKKGSLNRAHLGQVLDYFAQIKEQYPNDAVHPMLIGTDIGNDFKITLEKNNVEYKVIPESRFIHFAESKGIKLMELSRNDNDIERNNNIDLADVMPFNGDGPYHKNTNLLKAIHVICKIQKERPSQIRSNHPVAVEIIRNLQNIQKEFFTVLKDAKKQFHIKISKGQGYFSKNPWIDLLPNRQEPENGIFSGMVFDSRGKGIVLGCMESAKNRQGVSTRRCSIIDAGPFNNVFINPLELREEDIKEEAIFNHLLLSFNFAEEQIRNRS